MPVPVPESESVRASGTGCPRSHDETGIAAMTAMRRDVRPYSAGLASGGGGLAEGGVPAAALAAAAFFSTMATAMIEPS